MEKNTFVIRRAGDDLQHWKYVRREYDFDKRRYRYFYDETTAKGAGKSRFDDMIGRDEKKAYTTAKNTYNMHKDMTRFYETKARQLKNEHELHGRHTKSNPGLVKIARQNANYERSHIKNAKEVYDKALADYKKTPLYKIEQAKAKINKGKKWLAKKLGIN